MLSRLSSRIPVVFPAHPRTRERVAAAGIAQDSLIFTAPLGYLEFLRLTSEARLVITDSGGIQEETTILNVPCLTLRANTERPVTIEQGTNRLVGTDPETGFAAALETLDAPRPDRPAPDLWDGAASGRILDILEERMAGRPLRP
jgi:UDP-N-acetylglucosamine 2-epimerase (non-hydrolysing)